MGNQLSARSPRRERLTTTNPPAAYAEAYERYLIERGHARSSVQRCKDGVAHLQLWLHESRSPSQYCSPHASRAPRCAAVIECVRLERCATNNITCVSFRNKQRRA